jgi:RNA polymerase sigma-70 factor, ECF subfamily
VVTNAEALFAEHRQRLFLYFCRAVGHPDTARDLTQDVFLRVSRTVIPLAGADDLRAWLFRIARNLALDHHRRRERRPEQSLESTAGIAAITPHSPSQDRCLGLQEALATLGSLDRDVFLMREVAGLSYDEIAETCTISPDAVRSRLHRTRLRLRAHLSASLDDITSQPMRLTGGKT